MQPFLIAIDAGLSECFEKLKRVLDGLTEDELSWRPTLESNTIDWLVWHMARAEDDWINARLRNTESIWVRDGLAERIGGDDTGSGFGQSADEIRTMPAFDVPLVMEYYEAVRKGTSEYFANEMRETDPLKAIPQSGNYSLTYGGVLGHMLCEEAEHLGQIEYLRGMMRGLNG